MKDRPVLQRTLVLSLRLIIGELKLIIGRLFVVRVTRVASLVHLLQVADRDELASRWDVVDLTAHSHFLRVQWVRIVELHPVERLAGRAKCFPNLRRMC